MDMKKRVSIERYFPAGGLEGGGGSDEDLVYDNWSSDVAQ